MKVKREKGSDDGDTAFHIIISSQKSFFDAKVEEFRQTLCTSPLLFPFVHDNSFHNFIQRFARRSHYAFNVCQLAKGPWLKSC